MIYTKKVIPLSFIYFSIVLLIYLVHFTKYDEIEYIAKPAVLGVLMLLFHSNSHSFSRKQKLGICGGLVFSILGDVSFLLKNDINNLFIGGTFVFSICALLSYSYAMQFTSKQIVYLWNFKSLSLINLVLSLLIIIFPLSIFIVEDLETWQYPAIIHQFVIWVFIVQALKRQDLVNLTSYNLVLLGVFLYAITTIFLTLQNLTVNFIDFGSFTVITYFTAQYIFILGIIRQKD